MRTTHTYATLAVSPATLREIEARIRAAYSFDPQQAEPYFDTDSDGTKIVFAGNTGVALVPEVLQTVEGERRVQDHHRMMASELWATGRIAKLPALRIDHMHSFGDGFACALTDSDETAIMYAPTPMEAMALCLCELHVRSLMKIVQASRDGYLGMTKAGRLADRREEPAAHPVQQNASLGIARAKPVMHVVRWDWKETAPSQHIAELVARAPGNQAFDLDTNDDENVVIVAPKGTSEKERRAFFDHWCEHGD